MTETTNRLASLAGKFDRDKAKSLAAEVTFSRYLEMVYEDPRLARSAYQRIYDMIATKGVQRFKKYNKTVTRYKFFDDAEIPIFGLDDALENLVKAFRSAAGWYGTEKRILLLHGPVGSSKSTICRLLKKGLERVSRTTDGALYSFIWKNIPKELDSSSEVACPMHEDPLWLIPQDIRLDVEKDLNEIYEEQYNRTMEKLGISSPVYPLRLRGELCPQCKFYMEELLKLNDYDWERTLSEHISVRRIVFSEANRVGIGTFQPKDEKNQDATELTGDINFRKLGEIGKDSDPRCFSFDGELNISNRGACEFIEMLKLDKAFLYDLLGAAQERQIKPKKFAQTGIDCALIAHTNNPEYEKLRADKTMEALKDRTVKIDIPYLREWSKELRVLEHDYGKGKVQQHIAPHTLEILALWLVLTRLKDHASCTLVEKAKLYDGQTLPGWNEDRVREMHTEGEGMTGVSVRYGQNKVSNCLVSGNRSYVNAFMVLNECLEGLKTYSLIDNEDERKRYANCVELARKELDEILKKEVQRALVADDKAIERLCANYIDNVFAHIKGTKIKNQITGEDMDPDERLMCSIEGKIGIPDPAAPEFRRGIAAYIGNCSHEGKQFKWDTDARLKEALEKKLFEDTKDHIKISKLNVGAGVVSPDTLEKIDVVKKRLIEYYGYNEESARDVLDYVSGLFARGDVVE